MVMKFWESASEGDVTQEEELGERGDTVDEAYTGGW